MEAELLAPFGAGPLTAGSRFCLLFSLLSYVGIYEAGFRGKDFYHYHTIISRDCVCLLVITE